LSERRPSARVAAVIESRSRTSDWLRRYGVPELMGTGAAMLAAWAVDAAGAPLAAIAYAAAVGENIGFYGVIVAREIAAHHRDASAHGERYDGWHLWRTIRGLLLEFGPAELLDSLVLRPLAMALGVRFLGRQVGVIAGKLAADVSFYLPVILTYELRRQAARRAGS
jgi:hypothetical protein